MASKPTQARKRQLLSDLEDKRNAIKAGAVNLQQPVRGSRGDVDHPKIAHTRLIHKKVVEPVEALNMLSSASVFTNKVKTLADSKQIQKVIQHAKNLKRKSESKTLLEGFRKQPIKPLVMCCGTLFLLGSVFAKGEKTKKRKKGLEEEKIAKMGVGFLLLKWLLSASQPAVKYAITKKVKNGLFG